MYRKFIKRVLDFSFSLIILLIFSPIFILITLFLYFTNRGKPFFYQYRPGKNEKIFRVIKFKTMTDECDAQGNLLPDSARLSKIGKFVRLTSLDEIPQLINVLKGDMSLIGPRPLLVSYLPFYTKLQARRHEVKPGITGWAQVNGRNNMKFSSRFEHDVWYIDNLSFCLDLKILILTTKNVFTSSGVRLNQNVEEIDDLGFYNKIK